MIKQLQIASLIMLIVVLVVSCAPKPSATAEKKTTETSAIWEAPVDAVAEDISDAGNADEGLDTSELDDVDSILADIENI